MRPGTLAVLLGALVAAGAAAARADDPARVRACLAANAPRRSLVGSLVLRQRDALGRATTSRARAYWRRLPGDETRLLVRMQEPADVAGSSLLLIDDAGSREVWAYLPELGAVRRVLRSAQVSRVLGGELPLEDLRLLLDVAGRDDVELRGSGEWSGRPVWTLEARVADGADGGTTALRALVDRTWCLPLRVEYRDASGRVLRTLEVDPALVVKRAASWIPTHIVLEAPEADTRTDVSLEDVEIDGYLAPAFLSVGALPGVPSRPASEGDGAGGD